MSSSQPVALVTGGTTGIGLATAQELHKRGHAVVATGNNPATLAAARDRLPADVVVLQADSSKIASADVVGDALRNRFGRVDVVVLNAGIGRMMSIDAVDEAAFDEHFATSSRRARPPGSSTSRCPLRIRTIRKIAKYSYTY